VAVVIVVVVRMRYGGAFHAALAAGVQVVLVDEALPHGAGFAHAVVLLEPDDHLEAVVELVAAATRSRARRVVRESMIRAGRLAFVRHGVHLAQECVCVWCRGKVACAAGQYCCLLESVVVVARESNENKEWGLRAET
jgi:hypothetical protein